MNRRLDAFDPRSFEVVAAPTDRPAVPGEAGDLLGLLDGARQEVAHRFGERCALFTRIDTAMCGDYWPTDRVWVQRMREALAVADYVLRAGSPWPSPGELP
jgi:hypothetical protein